MPPPPSHISIATFIALPKCHWVVSIHLPRHWGRQYAPITLQWLVWYVPLFKTFPSHISVTDFTVSIFLYIIGLFRLTVLQVMSPTRSKAPQWFWYAPFAFWAFPSRIDLSQTPLFFCALEAVVRTLVQFDSINYALTIELMHRWPTTHIIHLKYFCL